MTGPSVKALKARAPLADSMIELTPSARWYRYKDTAGDSGAWLDVLVDDANPTTVSLTTGEERPGAPASVHLTAAQLAEVVALVVAHP